MIDFKKVGRYRSRNSYAHEVTKYEKVQFHFDKMVSLESDEMGFDIFDRSFKDVVIIYTLCKQTGFRVKMNQRKDARSQIRPPNIFAIVVFEADFRAHSGLSLPDS